MILLSLFKGVICNLSICITWHYTRNRCFWSSYFWVLRMITSHFCHIQFFFPQLVAVSVLSWFYADSCDPNKIIWSQHNYVIPTKSCDHNIIMWSQQNHVITTCHTVQIRSFLFNMRYLNRDKLWLGLFGCGWKTQILFFSIAKHLYMWNNKWANA